MVWPDVEALLLVPISAHALFSRPLVVAPSGMLAKHTDRVFADLRGDAPGVPDGMKVDEDGRLWTTGAGAELHRRSLYTFWKRTCPPPTMSTFDAPSRETCTIRRERTKYSGPRDTSTV